MKTEQELESTISKLEEGDIAKITWQLPKSATTYTAEGPVRKGIGTSTFIGTNDLLFMLEVPDGRLKDVELIKKKPVPYVNGTEKIEPEIGDVIATPAGTEYIFIPTRRSDEYPWKLIDEYVIFGPEIGWGLQSLTFTFGAMRFVR